MDLKLVSSKTLVYSKVILYLFKISSLVSFAGGKSLIMTLAVFRIKSIAVVLAVNSAHVRGPITNPC